MRKNGRRGTYAICGRRVGNGETQTASTVAGIASRVLLHPIDSIKTRMQTARGRGMEMTVWKTIRGGGIRGLYRGIVGSIIGVVPYSLLYMPSYEMAQSGWDVWFGKAQWLGLRHVVAGSVAGFCGSMVKVPMDVVKKRLQAGLYPNIGVAFSAIAKEGGGKLLPGILRFYTGWRSAIVYDIPYNAVQFSVLENVKNVARKVKNEDIQGFDNVAVGAVTGVITSLVTEPLDVVKTRMMTQRVRGAVSDVTVTVYTGWLHCVKTMVKEEGVAALWKGTLPRLVWVGASSAVWYGTYQMTREALGKRRVAKAQRKQQSQNFMPHASRRDVETNKIHMLKL